MHAHKEASLILAIVLSLAGCGPNITSGKVVKLETKPAWTEPAHTTRVYVPNHHGVGHFITTYHPAKRHPESYFIVVNGHDHGSWGDRRIRVGSNFNGYKVGDLWKEQSHRAE